jgi:hypothetical protein
MLNLINAQSNQLTFSDGRYYSTQWDEWVPSVTTILEAYPKPYQLLQWMKEKGSAADELRDMAGRRGSAVHQLTEDYDNGIECKLLSDVGTPIHSLEVWGMFERYVNFCSRFNPQNILIEHTVISPALGYAGTIDRVSDIRGKRYLIDIKTSNTIANNYWLQLAAYRELLKQDKTITQLDGVGILWLNAKTRTEGKADQMQGNGWQLILQKDGEIEKSLRLFNCVHQLWLHENEGQKPKLLTYQTKHKKQKEDFELNIPNSGCDNEDYRIVAEEFLTHLEDMEEMENISEKDKKRG